MEWKYQMPWVLAILTNCLGSCSSLNFNVSEKGEMPTDPVSQATPVLSFYALDTVVREEEMDREKREKCNMDTLYDSIYA